jgi:hypothetical protein
MTIDEVQRKLNFAIAGSLKDAIGQAIPNFLRNTPIVIEEDVNDSRQFEPVAAFLPAFAASDGSLLLEPAGTNEITWPLRVNRAEWVKGSNVVVAQDRSIAPDGTHLADRVTWTGGTGVNSILRRSLELEPGQDYVLSLYLRLQPGGGKFGANDVVRVIGAEGNPEVSLNQLNGWVNKYRLIELKFNAGGIVPESGISANEDWAVDAVSTTTVTLTLAGLSIGEDALQGSRLEFDSGDVYEITANTASSSNQVVFTLDATNLPGDGITTANRVTLTGPAPREIDIEIYSESVASIDWGMADLKEGVVRTSPIIQNGQKETRSDSYLIYRESPFEALNSFGAFFDIKFLRGEGVLIASRGFVIWLDDNNILSCQLDTTVLATPNPIPTENVKIFVQVSAESTSLAIYINGILEARSTVPDANLPDSALSFVSAGVRCHNVFLGFAGALTDGAVAQGQRAGDEVRELFETPEILPSNVISSQSPGITLPEVAIPGIPVVASTAIDSIDRAAREVTVVDATGFTNNSTAFLIRDDVVRTRVEITGIAANVFSVDSVAGLKPGDLFVLGDYDRPSRVTVRMPVTPFDAQEIESIDSGNSTVEIQNTISFDQSPALVQRDYVDVGAFQILGKDDVASELTLDGTNGLEVGDIIFQPATELLIDPQNYTVLFLEDIGGIKVTRKARDSFEIENQNVAPVVVTPQVIVNL